MYWECLRLHHNVINTTIKTQTFQYWMSFCIKIVVKYNFLLNFSNILFDVFRSYIITIKPWPLYSGYACQYCFLSSWIKKNFIKSYITNTQTILCGNLITTMSNKGFFNIFSLNNSLSCNINSISLTKDRELPCL